MEEILYDTSVLIEKIKHGKKIEGAVTIFSVIEFPKCLSVKNLKVLFPDNEDFLLAIKIAKDLLVRGTPVPTVDILISAMVIRRGFTLYTKDKHFSFIREVAPQLRIKFPEK